MTLRIAKLTVLALLLAGSITAATPQFDGPEPPPLCFPTACPGGAN